jgi:hypothetical protein
MLLCRAQTVASQRLQTRSDSFLVRPVISDSAQPNRCPEPILSAIQPSTGPVAGNNMVTLIGANLGGQITRILLANVEVSIVSQSDSEVHSVPELRWK